MFIEKITELSDEIYESVCRLVPQLGTHKVVPTRDEMETLIDWKASNLLVARYPDNDSPIVGILTSAIYHVPTGVRSIVEDVIVDNSLRRKGIAKALMLAAVEVAHEAGANGVALTSNSQRVEANLLYKNMGFSKRETNAYFYKLK
jgi:ribosomal protein S18 acetylase RimI-like enzyme